MQQAVIHRWLGIAFCQLVVGLEVTVVSRVKEEPGTVCDSLRRRPTWRWGEGGGHSRQTDRENELQVKRGERKMVAKGSARIK